jgi:hypothetical protein
VAAEDDVVAVGDWGELGVYDVSDPIAPQLVSVLELQQPGIVTDAVFRNDLVYLVQRDVGLWIVDLTEPPAPVVLGYLATPGQARALRLEGHHVYVADGTAGLRMIDVADPTAPVEIGHHDTGDDAQGLFVDGGRIYLADGDDGLWILRDDLATAVPDDGTPAARANRLAVYPNPFNPRTSMAFALERPQAVRLAICDLAGREIVVLAERSYEAGRHTVTWDGRGAAGRAVATGTYVVRLAGEGWTEGRKVTLVR